MKNIYITLLIICAIAGNAQNINIPDPVFKARLLGNNSTALNAQGNSFSNTADSNNDGEISMAEAAAVTGLRIHSLTSSSNISSLEGLQYFTNLKSLWCESNPVGGQLNLSMLTQLKYLNCRSMQLTSLLLPTTGTLEEINASENSLTSFPTMALQNLKVLELYENNITAINLIPLNQLFYLVLSGNPLVNIDLSGNPILETLYINNSQISILDCSSTMVKQLACSNNPNLTTINVKNNKTTTSDPDMLYFGFSFYNLPLLETICLDNQNPEIYSVATSGYNSNGNVIVYTGANCDEVVNMNTNGIADVSKNNLKIYPNPVTDVLHIENLSGSAITEIEIFNSLGQKIKVPFTTSASRADVSQLAGGNYIVKAVDENGFASTQKFVKI